MKNLLKLHEAIVIALINQPTRTADFNTIAEFIVQRKLFPLRKGNISLAKQIMLRSTKSNGACMHLFEYIGKDYIRLRNTIDLLYNYSLLETIIEHKRQQFNPDEKHLNVVDYSFGLKKNHKIKISPADIICIKSVEKSRKKKIFIQKKELSENLQIFCYQINNNKLNFESLRDYLDQSSKHLAIISKSTIVNVAFYDLQIKNKLTLIPTYKNFKIPTSFTISKSSKAKQYLNTFIKMKESYTDFILLQKAAIGYKNDMKL